MACGCSTDNRKPTVHDPDYRTSWKDWESFVDSISEKLAEKDETIPELPAKDCVFRIYRDVRFSSDPTPYKVCTIRAWSENFLIPASLIFQPLGASHSKFPWFSIRLFAKVAHRKERPVRVLLSADSARGKEFCWYVGVMQKFCHPLLVSTDLGFVVQALDCGCQRPSLWHY